MRRAAPRLAFIAGLVLLLCVPQTGGVLWGFAWVALVLAVWRCLNPAWLHYVRSGDRPPGWLASEPAGEWNVVLEAPGRRPIEIMRVLRKATGESLAPVKDAVEGAPSTVARGVSAPSAERLVAALIAAGAVSRTSPTADDPTRSRTDDSEPPS